MSGAEREPKIKPGPLDTSILPSVEQIDDEMERLRRELAPVEEQLKRLRRSIRALRYLRYMATGEKRKEQHVDERRKAMGAVKF